MNHSWSHPNLAELEPDALRHQIVDTSDVILQLTGAQVQGMRPPYGSHNEAVDAFCRQQGLWVLTWSASTDDWDHNDANKSFAAVQRLVHDGAIILCHDRSSTAKAVSMIVPWLWEQGYEVGSVKELLESRNAHALPGMTLTRVEDAL